MALSITALMRYVTNTIPNHSAIHDKVADFPEYRDNLDLAFRYYSLGLASGASSPLGTSDEADIRLLEIFPHPTGSGRIRCAMHHYCFIVPAQRISYRALSYVWGDGDQDRLIVIDGNDAREEAATPYDERYLRHADEVVAYLGEEAENSDLVVDFASLLLEKLGPLQTGEPILINNEASLTRHGLPPTTHPGWKALRDLYKRSWFERKWIVQEFVLAKLVLCILGDSNFNFELLVLAHKLCLRHGLHKIQDPETGSPLTIPNEHPLTVLVTIRDLVRYNCDEDNAAKVKSLPCLLAATSYAKVSKWPHDHLYALLSINMVSGSMIGVYPLIDYSRSAEDVFIDYACIDDWKEDDADMSLLELASQSKNLSGLPSWVPDWTSPTQLGYVVHKGPSPGMGVSIGRDRSAFTFNRDRRTLTVRAALFDTVGDDSPGWQASRLSLNAEMENTGFDYLKELSTLKEVETTKRNLALVPYSTQVGDSIFIILGERVPFVLRKAGPLWRVIGAAYVPCIMKGQGLDVTSQLYVGGDLEDITLV